MANNEQRKEDDFFYKLDRELILAARRQAESEAQLRDLSAITGISDRQILQDLQRFDFTAETASLLDLMPLVQVAWTDGSVNRQERERVFRIARLGGIDESDLRWQRLVRYLDGRPSDEFFRVTLRALRASFEGLPLEERRRRERALVMHCTSVAAVSGGFLGLGSRISDAEQSAISEIVAVLDRSGPADQEG